MSLFLKNSNQLILNYIKLMYAFFVEFEENPIPQPRFLEVSKYVLILAINVYLLSLELLNHAKTFRFSTGLLIQNLRQIGPGVLELWSWLNYHLTDSPQILIGWFNHVRCSLLWIHLIKLCLQNRIKWFIFHEINCKIHKGIVIHFLQFYIS